MKLAGREPFRWLNQHPIAGMVWMITIAIVWGMIFAQIIGLDSVDETLTVATGAAVTVIVGGLLGALLFGGSLDGAEGCS